MMRQPRNHILQDNSGVAMVEFALVLPLLLLLLYGALELTRFAIAHQKVDKVAFAMADLTTQNTSYIGLESKLRGYAEVDAPKIIKPLPFEGTVIFSSISGRLAQPDCTAPVCVNWQLTYAGSDASKISEAGNNNATLPSDYVVLPGQDVITVEVYFKYEPLMNISRDLLAALSASADSRYSDGIALYKAAVYKPRQGRLTTVPTP